MNFIAKVHEIINVGGYLSFILDHTIFIPETTTTVSDVGYINEYIVANVKNHFGTIIHITTFSFIEFMDYSMVDKEVTCKIEPFINGVIQKKNQFSAFLKETFELPVTFTYNARFCFYIVVEKKDFPGFNEFSTLLIKRINKEKAYHLFPYAITSVIPFSNKFFIYFMFPEDSFLAYNPSLYSRFFFIDQQTSYYNEPFIKKKEAIFVSHFEAYNTVTPFFIEDGESYRLYLSCGTQNYMLYTTIPEISLLILDRVKDLNVKRMGKSLSCIVSDDFHLLYPLYIMMKSYL